MTQHPMNGDGAADSPPLAWFVPTPAEWVEHWNDLTPDQRLKKAEIILGSAEQASRCMLMEHDAAVEELRKRFEATLLRPSAPSGEAP